MEFFGVSCLVNEEFYPGIINCIGACQINSFFFRSWKCLAQQPRKILVPTFTHDRISRPGMSQELSRWRTAPRSPKPRLKLLARITSKYRKAKMCRLPFQKESKGLTAISHLDLSTQ